MATGSYLSHDGSVQFFTRHYLDDQVILQFDTENNRTKPWEPQTETYLGTDTWNTESQELAENEKNLGVALADGHALGEHKRGDYGQCKKM